MGLSDILTDLLEPDVVTPPWLPSSSIISTNTSGFPRLVVLLAVGFGPYAVPPTWYDISAYAQSFSWTYGRQQTLGRTETGQGTLRLNNQGRQFDPVLHPELTPMNRIQIMAEYRGTTYPLAYGYVKGWPQQWEGHRVGYTTVPFEDAFSVLARQELLGLNSLPALPTGQHLEAVLDQVGWPSAIQAPAGTIWWSLGVAGYSELGTTTVLGSTQRSFDTGRSVIQATTPSGNLLEWLLQAAEDTEWGRFFAGPSGELAFVQRGNETPQVAGNFGDDGADSTLPYVDLTVTSDDSFLYTDAQISVVGEVDDQGNQIIHETKSDPAVDAYGLRTLTRTVLFSNTAEADAQGSYILNLFATPRLRPDQIVLLRRPDADPAGTGSRLWAQMLGNTIGSRISLARNPDNQGSILLDARIAAITHDADASSKGWQTTWRLEAVPPEFDWLLGVYAVSELDVSAYLGW